MIKIRQMVEEDINAVRQVEVQGFGPWLKRYVEDPTQLPQRTRDNIRSLMSKDPEGAFVAEIENQVAGFIFSRTWGGVGWFGTFAVSPEH